MKAIVGIGIPMFSLIKIQKKKQPKNVYSILVIHFKLGYTHRELNLLFCCYRSHLLCQHMQLQGGK